MNVPTPMNNEARDDRFNRGLERLLQGDPTGIDEIEPELQDTAIELVKLANDAGWLGADPGATVVAPTPWWRNGRYVINAVAAVLMIGLIAMMATLAVRVWDPFESQFGSNPTEESIIELGPGVCEREQRSYAEIAAIVRKSETEVTPFESDGVYENGTIAAVGITRDWNACLQAGNWQQAMAYESEFFIWLLGQDVFPNGVDGLSDEEIVNALADRHSLIVPIDTVDGMNLAIYSADTFRQSFGASEPRLRGVDVWLAPVDQNGDWIQWPTVVSIEWDGSQWVIVSATREGVPDSEYFRHDALPNSTPEDETSP